ncbi:hypothetical protein LCGC14_0562790 [marine sediment metagenome]|uniref:ParB-like N-terminal domain-containing protein n=1 Tax=marine sediment metagenome TaxID=412755 RepID=A0A0F9UUS0_9ZZZZ
MNDRVIQVQPSQIDLGWRARTDTAEIDALADTIKRDGQITPIALSKQKGKKPYELIAGFRRMMACKKLKRKVLAVIVANQHAESALRIQIIENVQRRNFSSIEMGEALIRWKGIFDTKPDKFPKNGKKQPRFSLYVALQLHIAESTAALAIQLATTLSAEDKKRINGIADTKKRSEAERKALSEIRRMSRERRLHKKAEERQRQRKQSESDDEGTGASLHRVERGDWQSWIPKWMDKSYKFDLCLTDPPYSLHWSPIAYKERKALGEAPSWDQLDVSWVFEVAKAMSATATIVSFCSVEAVGTYQNVFDEMGWKYRGALIWHKTDPAPQSRPGYSHAKEAIVWATRGTAHFTPWKNAGSSEAHDVITGPTCRGKERFDHPTQKPVWLMERLLRRHASKGHLVVDPFAGVGSTLVACKQLDIAGLGCEQKQKFHKIAISRLEVAQLK